MKKLFITFVLTCCLVGCTTTQPATVQTDPLTGLTTTNRATVVVDTNKINAVIAQLQAVNSASVPVNPYTVPIQTGLTIIGGLVTGISLVVAAAKNKQLNTANGVVSTVVGAIESLPASYAPIVKSAVRSEAANAGTSADVHAAVQANT